MNSGWGAPPPPAAMNAVAAGMFQKADTQRTGRINIQQMQTVLVTKSGRPFCFPLLFSLVNMFDATKTATVSLEEWGKLWDYLMFWKAKFDSVDQDGSGQVNFNEFNNLVLNHTPFRTIMNDQQIFKMNTIIFDRFDFSRSKALTFDEYVYGTLTLQRLHGALEKKRDKATNQATFTPEEFLISVLECL